MRILATQPFADAVGHYGKYTARVCQELSRRGHSVVLCANSGTLAGYLSEPPGFSLQSVGPDYSFARYDRIRARSHTGWLLGRIRNNVATLRLAQRLARRRTFDVLQLFSYELVSTWAVLRRMRRLPPAVIEISAANFDAGAYPGGYHARAWKLAQRYALRAMLGSSIVGINVNSRSHVEPLRRQLALPDTFPIGVISDAREIPEHALSQETARQRLELPPPPTPLFLYFGMLRVEKGVDVLLEAVARLQSRDFRVVIAGTATDWSPRKLADTIARLKIGGHVIARLGYIPEDDVSTYFYAADAVVLPYSRAYTGSSGPLYDATAHGKAVIGTAVSDIGLHIRDYQFGWVAEPDDPGALATRLAEYLDAPAEQRRAASDNALAFAQRHTRARVAEELQALYERVLDRRG